MPELHLVVALESTTANLSRFWVSFLKFLGNTFNHVKNKNKTSLAHLFTPNDDMWSNLVVKVLESSNIYG